VGYLWGVVVNHIKGGKQMYNIYMRSYDKMQTNNKQKCFFVGFGLLDRNIHPYPLNAHLRAAQIHVSMYEKNE